MKAKAILNQTIGDEYSVDILMCKANEISKHSLHYMEHVYKRLSMGEIPLDWGHYSRF
jgi:hypothetical protein